MSTERRAAIINDIHKLQEGTSTEAEIKIAISKLLILQRAESSKHEDESLQLYALIDELTDKLVEQKRVYSSLELATNQKASEISILQKEAQLLKRKLLEKDADLNSLSRYNSMLFSAISILNSQFKKLTTKKGRLKDYKKITTSAVVLIAETITNCTPKE
ncbi:MAG: hypothetical protein ACKUBY_02030 [Candidatus Moraniibacteriota bacterium]|jgi:chromosome segregation ATPase